MSYEDKLGMILRAMGREEEYKKICERRYIANGTVKKVYNHNLEVNDKAYLIPLADPHIGHRNFNLNKMLDFVMYILNTPDTYTILLGDQAECATRTSIGLGIFEEDMNSDEQLDILVQMMSPLVKAGKILGIHTGNHEYRFPIHGANNPAALLADRLNVPYLEYQGYHCINVINKNTGDKQLYTMMSFHGTGNCETLPAIIRACEKSTKICPNADLYISGHAHLKNYHTDDVFFIDPNSDTMVLHTRHHVICGSFLEYWGSYAEMRLMSPHITGAVMISLGSKNKEIVVRS